MADMTSDRIFLLTNAPMSLTFKKLDAMLALQVYRRTPQLFVYGNPASMSLFLPPSAFGCKGSRHADH
jgi:hypothetical protein